MFFGVVLIGLFLGSLEVEVLCHVTCMIQFCVRSFSSDPSRATNRLHLRRTLDPLSPPLNLPSQNSSVIQAASAGLVYCRGIIMLFFGLVNVICKCIVWRVIVLRSGPAMSKSLDCSHVPVRSTALFSSICVSGLPSQAYSFSACVTRAFEYPRRKVAIGARRIYPSLAFVNISRK